ncbi:hypothetical protein THI4931_39880 [Pandoraea sputorum]|nr:hypothetical protein THI4931_39880 [Pandoraea sputorum]
MPGDAKAATGAMSGSVITVLAIRDFSSRARPIARGEATSAVGADEARDVEVQACVMPPMIPGTAPSRFPCRTA